MKIHSTILNSENVMNVCVCVCVQCACMAMVCKCRIGPCLMRSTWALTNKILYECNVVASMAIRRERWKSEIVMNACEFTHLCSLSSFGLRISSWIIKKNDNFNSLSCIQFLFLLFQSPSLILDCRLKSNHVLHFHFIHRCFLFVIRSCALVGECISLHSFS